MKLSSPVGPGRRKPSNPDGYQASGREIKPNKMVWDVYQIDSWIPFPPATGERLQKSLFGQKRRLLACGCRPRLEGLGASQALRWLLLKE